MGAGEARKAAEAIHADYIERSPSMGKSIIPIWEKMIEKFIKAAQAETREQCAQIAEQESRAAIERDSSESAWNHCRNIVDKIRAQQDSANEGAK